MTAIERAARDLLDATRLVHCIPHGCTIGDRCHACSRPWPCPWERARRAVEDAEMAPSIPGDRPVTACAPARTLSRRVPAPSP